MEIKYTEAGTVINGETFGNNTVSMLLYGKIDVPNPDGTPSINSTAFVNEMMTYNKEGKHVVVKINSPGGSVYGGLSIMESIEDIGADTYVTGMAGSIAGVILQSGKKRFANPRATWMAHAPSSKNSQAAKRHINIVRDTLKNSLTGRSVLNEEAIDKIMNGTEELYFSANDMYTNGLVDEVIESGKPLDLQLVNMSSNELYTAYDSLLNNKTKPIKMENVMNHLGLENKSEADVLNIVKELESKAAKVEPLELELTNLKDEVKTLKESAKEAQEQKATELITNSIESGKIKEDAKDVWNTFALDNYSLCESTLKEIPVSKTSTKLITNVIDNSVYKKTATKGKTYAELAKESPEVLVDLYENNIDEFNKLTKEHNAKN